VALADTAGVAIAKLEIGPDGLQVERFVDLRAEELPPTYAAGDPEGVASTLQLVLQQHGLDKRLTCLGLDDSLIGASLADLPEAKGRVLSALVARHVREELPMQQAPVLGDLVRVDRRHETDPATRCWLAWSEKELMNGVGHALSTRSVKVGRILPPSVATLDMLGRTLEARADRTELVVRFCWPSVVIGVFIGGSPHYARFLGDLLVDSPDDPVKAGITELHRTVAFLRERNRGRAPDMIRYTGLDEQNSKDFEQRVSESLGIPSAPVRISATGEHEAGRHDRLTVLASLLYHAADRKRGREHTLNMLPDQAKSDHWLLVGLGVAVMATAVISFANFDMLSEGNLSIGARRASMGAEDVRLGNQAQERARQRADLTLREAWLGALSMVPNEHTDPVRPLLDAVVATPDGVELNSAVLDCGYADASSLDLQLSGDFTGTAAESVMGFLRELKSRPWTASLQAERGDLAFGKEGAKALEDLGVKVTFR
jgi:hypothetical protein